MLCDQATHAVLDLVADGADLVASLPAGSGSSQSRHLSPGKNGQGSPQPTVVTTSEACTASVDSVIARVLLG
jgi:hypothetical protein